MAGAVGWGGAASAADRVLVFAAASTTAALERIADRAGELGFPTFTLVAGASSTLARQIEAGAPAALFLSANQNWMDHLEAAGAIDAESRTALLSNRLALVAGDRANKAMTLRELAKMGPDGLIAMADPDHVPVGLYAKAALTFLGFWPAFQSRIAAAADARAAIQFVARGETAYGLTYRTDARLSDRVSVLELIPEDSHPPIIYPVAIVKHRDGPQARRILTLLTSNAARREFERSGFTVLTKRD